MKVIEEVKGDIKDRRITSMFTVKALSNNRNMKEKGKVK